MVKFKSDFSKKLLYIEIIDPVKIIADANNGFNQFKQLWCSQLKHWHSPYKAVINFNNHHYNLKITSDFNDQLTKIIKFFTGFFLQKVVCYGLNLDIKDFPIIICKDKDHALKTLGIRLDNSCYSDNQQLSIYDRTRNALIIDNDIDNYVVELGLGYQLMINQNQNIDAIKSKLTNNLIHWHSFWCLIVDGSNILSIDQKLDKKLAGLIKFFHGFFLKSVVIYNVNHLSFDAFFYTNSLITVTRSRHKALMIIKKQVSKILNNHPNNSSKENRCVVKS